MEKYLSKEQALTQLTGRFPKDMSLEKYIGLVTCRINELATIDVIPIPDQTTNGDMVTAMFPDYQIKIGSGQVCLYYSVTEEYSGSWIRFDEEWWNAPFRKEREKKNNDTR